MSTYTVAVLDTTWGLKFTGWIDPALSTMYLVLPIYCWRSNFVVVVYVKVTWPKVAFVELNPLRETLYHTFQLQPPRTPVSGVGGQMSLSAEIFVPPFVAVSGRKALVVLSTYHKVPIEGRLVIVTTVVTGSG